MLAIPETVWEMEDAGKPNRFAALDRTRHILFRFVTDFEDWRTSADRPLWESWRHLLEPVLAQATAPFGYARGAFPRVMLARLAPGGIIAPHRDGSVAALWPHKIHVPLVTHERADFFVNGSRYQFEAGHAYEVNNLGVHAAANHGATARIHLIFEYYDLDQAPPEWILGNTSQIK